MMKKLTSSISALTTFILIFTFNFSISYSQDKNIEGTIYGVGKNNHLYVWQNNAWKHIPNSGDVTDIAVMKDGTIIGIGKNKQLYTRTNTSWVNVPNSGDVFSIAVTEDGSILGVGKNKNLYRNSSL